MKQRLGEKKQRRCTAITGQPYVACYTRGGWTHGTAECWFGDASPYRDADLVNYLTGEHQPYLRDGERVR